VRRDWQPPAPPWRDRSCPEGLVDHDPGEQQQHDERQNGGHEDPLEAVGEMLRRRLLRLGLADHLDDLGQRRVAWTGGSPAISIAPAPLIVPAKTLCSGATGIRLRRAPVGIVDRSLVDRHALAGDRRLIDA
jgi:hypothetical protein